MKGNMIYNPIAGKGTYCPNVFTTSTQLVDGSALRLPSWGCYSLDGKDIEFTGLQPDIKVLSQFDDKMNGRDPQLDKAIEVILGRLAAPLNPPAVPAGKPAGGK
jgi:C-terminal processing protease CtpA/Prc